MRRRPRTASTSSPPISPSATAGEALLDGAVKKLGTISLFVHAASPRRLEVDTPLTVTRGDLGRHDRRQPALRLLPRSRDRPAHARHRTKGRILLITSHASRDRRARCRTTRRLEGRHDHGDEGAGARAGARRHPRQRHRTRRHPGRRLRRGNMDELVAQIPLGRAGTPDDIAQVAVAVLSERFGRYVVGTTVEVDGGLGLISWIPPRLDRSGRKG